MGTIYPRITGGVQAWAMREKRSADMMELWKEPRPLCLSLFGTNFIGASLAKSRFFSSIQLPLSSYESLSQVSETISHHSLVPPWQDSVQNISIWQQLSNFCLLANTVQRPLSARVKELLKSNVPPLHEERLQLAEIATQSSRAVVDLEQRIIQAQEMLDGLVREHNISAEHLKDTKTLRRHCPRGQYRRFLASGDAWLSLLRAYGLQYPLISPYPTSHAVSLSFKLGLCLQRALKCDLALRIHSKTDLSDHAIFPMLLMSMSRWKRLRINVPRETLHSLSTYAGFLASLSTLIIKDSPSGSEHPSPINTFHLASSLKDLQRSLEILGKVQGVDAFVETLSFWFYKVKIPPFPLGESDVPVLLPNVGFIVAGERASASSSVARFFKMCREDDESLLEVVQLDSPLILDDPEVTAQWKKLCEDGLKVGYGS
ncbi:hypothetical protein F5146DRAFT_1123310 [Armillaria mellea]|nr:hypothetical protein F5146DRAFT_1123310 [Armillaria mellea]